MTVERPCPLCQNDLLDGEHTLSTFGGVPMLGCPLSLEGQTLLFNTAYLRPIPPIAPNILKRTLDDLEC